MRMRKTVLIHLAILIVVSSIALARPIYNSAVLDFKTPIEDFLPVESKIYIAFSNGTLSLIDLENSLIISQVVMPLGMSTVCLAYNQTTFIIVDSSGVGVILNSSTLQPIRSFNLKTRNDELYVTRCALSGDGRFLALSISYQINNVKLDRLVVFDLLKRARVFERDVNSQDVLVKLFSLNFYRNYLVVETIDTLCELCQLTDNKIEVYSVKPNGIEKVASLQTGLTLKSVGNGYILAQQVKEDNGLHNTFILTLPDLTIRAQKKMPTILQISPLNSSFAVVFSSGALTRCGFDLDCADIFSVPVIRAARIFTDSMFSVFTVGEVSLYSTDYKSIFTLVGRYQVNWTTVPFDPTVGKASSRIHVAKYGSNRLVILYSLTKSLLYLKVTTAEGVAIPNTTVTLSSPSGTFTLQTNSTGWATGVLPLDNYTVEVLKPGYSPTTLTLIANQPSMYLTIKISKEPPRRLPLTIKISDEQGNPLPGAKITITGPEIYELQTTFEGTAYVEALRGNYTLIVKAPLYSSEKLNFSLVSPLMLNLTLKRQKFNLTICSSINASGKILIKPIDSSYKEILLNVSPHSCQEKVVDAGTYQLSIIESPKGLYCNLNRTTIDWTENVNRVSVSYACSNPRVSSNASLSEVLLMLKNETLISKNLSKPLSLGTVSLLGGAQLDLLETSYRKILVIELFYTQCTGCKYILPALRSLSQRNDTVVVSLTVSPSDTPDILRRYSIENNVSWFLGSDDLNIRSQVNASSFPTVLVVKDGKLFFIGIGASREIEEAKNKYSSLFNITALPFGSITGRITLPETLILTGVLLIILALLPGGGNAREEGKEEEDNLSFYSGDVYPISDSLRGYNAEAIDSLEDRMLDDSSEWTSTGET